MDEHLNNRQNKILWNLLANPVDNGHLYVDDLQRLVTDFPQSGLLHALLSHAESGQNVSHAAAYTNPKTLYVLCNAPEDLAELNDEQIIQQLSTFANYAATFEEADVLEQEIETNTIQEEAYLDDGPEQIFSEVDYAPLIEKATNGQIDIEAEPGEVEQDLVYAEPESEEVMVVEQDEKATSADTSGDEPEPMGEFDDIINSGGDIRKDELLTESQSFELSEAPRGIDDEVYDEIVGIENISLTPAPKHDVETAQPEEIPVIDEEVLPEAAANGAWTEPALHRTLNMDDEAEKLIVGNIAATDYFVFDKAFNDRRQAEPVENVSSALPADAVNGTDLELVPNRFKKDVSKYNDDTLPYTFMWWLNKTRKEHAGIYQPFKLDTTQSIKQSGAEELQQQYYENIFHLSSVEELQRSTPQQPVEFDLKNKDDRIIKRFIVEEPHINPPSSDKLDTENKARKSAEDQDVFVTETLARIYTDQMLYHKAINTYKKLMLKFPEKSRYFADQIEQLERKTN